MLETNDFADIYEKFSARIFNYINKHISNRQDAEDLTADVFCSAFKSWEQYDPDKCPIAAWFYIIAANRLKNYYRDKRVPISLDANDAFLQISDDISGEAMLLIEKREIIAKALLSLSERERQIVISKYFLDLSNDEIARRMSLSQVNVRVISTRALKKMRIEIENRGIF